MSKVVNFKLGEWTVMQDLNLRPVGLKVPKPSALFFRSNWENGR